MMTPVRLEECLIKTNQVLGACQIERKIAMNDAHLEMTADIVAAYVSNNPVPANELASVIASIYASISTLEQ